MTFTWTGDPSASTIEQIRFEIWDTDSTNVRFQDAEIEYAYDQEHSIYNAAARLCEVLSVRYSDAVDRTMGPLRVSLGDKSKFYALRAQELRKKAMKLAVPYVGGHSDAKKSIFENDSDLIQPAFEKGIMDNE